MSFADFSNVSPEQPLAVLVSGGVDSAVLLGVAARRFRHVQPLYIRCRLLWESVELFYLQKLLSALAAPSVRPLVILEMPADDLYGQHWSVRGQDVPDAHSPDDAVYLPGRNLLLLSKALLWCHLHDVPVLALGTLRGNPFFDASATFMNSLAALVNQAYRANLRIIQPFRQLDKSQVLTLGSDLPLRWTFSCIAPKDYRHCGRCNKCEERRKAFALCAMPDPAEYAFD